MSVDKKRIIEIGRSLKTVDSKSEEAKLKEELKSLNPAQFDGMAVMHEGKMKRIRHAFFASFYVYGNKTTHYNWSNNRKTVTLDDVDFIDEPDFIHSKLCYLNNKIDQFNNEIEELERARSEMQKTCLHRVGEFYENGNLIKHTIGESIQEEAECEICGKIITT